MAPPIDPYRTLGLTSEASFDEVRRAYRRLAKANHPDTAGEAAAPRFMAIKAAYEAIAGPGAADAGRGGRRPPTPRRPWEAETDRAEATRRAYGSRGRPPRTRPGAAPRPDAAPPPPPDPDAEVRPPNLATLGSTTYDGADREPFEPDWGGASWYGTTSGTYWTLNPKEYADPRKHGPEYQARARRAARRGGPSAADLAAADLAAADLATPVDPVPPDGPVPVDDPAPQDDQPVEPTADAAADGAAAAAAADAAGPTHTTGSWWDATAGSSATDPRPGSEPGSPTDAFGPGPPTASPPGLVRDRWLDPGRFGLAGRVGYAVIGWAPIAAAIGVVAGELSGCARAAASCGSADAPLAGLAQIVVLAVLLLVPLLARTAATAAAVVLAVAIPASLILGASGAATGGEAGTGTVSPAGPLVVVVAIVLVLVWLVGFAWAGVKESRRGSSPVS